MLRAIRTISTQWKPLSPSPTLRTLPKIASSLSKVRLSALVTCTMLSGHLISTPIAPMPTILLGIVGTALASASAASFNQWLEAPFDSQMSRTRCRILPSIHALPTTALHLGVLAGVSGGALLLIAGGITPASLAMLNIALYAGVYTPMKRYSVMNTWVGAAVGAIPPLIGWSLGGGELSDVKAYILPAILFAWQFPHFNALSWRLREEYARAGYWMTAVTRPRMNKFLAVGWAVALIPISLLSVNFGLCSPSITTPSLVINGYLLFNSFQFHRHSSNQTARSLFLSSLVHLPLLMGFLIYYKTPDAARSK